MGLVEVEAITVSDESTSFLVTVPQSLQVAIVVDVVAEPLGVPPASLTIMNSERACLTE